MRTMSLCFVLLFLLAAEVPGETPWPAEVKGFTAPKPGEHPRLLFRKADLPALKKKAQTPEGKAILARLRKLLDGADGNTMTRSFNPQKGPIAKDGSGKFAETAPLGTYTFSHVVGYGLLYQLTGEKKYADLGKQCIEKALEGYRDRDLRYAFKAPFGSLRAGPVLGLTAVGYDLCHDGWDEDFRKKVAGLLANYDEGGNKKEINLATLVKGSMPPGSNHYGMQVGGAALALLAVRGDPGVDTKRIDALLQTSQKSMLRNLTEGFGDGGFFAEGDGTGSMSSHIVFLTALQAWKNAAGKDFITPRCNAQMMAMKWVYLTVPRKGEMDFWPKRGGYPHNVWSRQGLSGGGYFGIGLGAVTREQKAALVWFYEHALKDADAKKDAPFDTVSVYPHHAVCSFVNWPLDVKPRNPADVLPLAYRDTKWSFFACRNRWKDADDVVVSALTKNARGYIRAPADRGVHVVGLGKKFTWVKLAGEMKHYQAAKDGSVSVTMADGTAFAVDFSKASGAEAMLITTGTAEGVKAKLGGQTLTVRFLSKEKEPKVEVKADALVIGGQTVTLRDGNLVLAAAKR
jgi:hypothetical protein